MWLLYSLLGLLLLLVVILSVPIYGRITYNGAFSVRIRVLGIPVSLLPQNETASPPVKSSAKAKAEQPSKLKEIATLMKQDDVAGTLRFLGEVATLAGKTVGRLLRSITVTDLNFQMRIATEDPAVTAQRYGQICSVLYPALALIEHWVRIRRRHLRVEPNFLLSDTAVRFDIRLQVSLWRLLGAALALLWGFVILKEKNNPQITKEVS